MSVMNRDQIHWQTYPGLSRVKVYALHPLRPRKQLLLRVDIILAMEILQPQGERHQSDHLYIQTHLCGYISNGLCPGNVVGFKQNVTRNVTQKKQRLSECLQQTTISSI